MNKIAIIFKTHIWNSFIENFILKIQNDLENSKSKNINLFILLHSENDNIIPDSNSIKKLIIRFTENDIKNTYSIGYYTIWLSNHWILMWFYKNMPNFDYYWSIEYDVRISGDSCKIWEHESCCDFLYVMGNYVRPKNIYNNHYVGNKLLDADKYHGYLQLARYSNKALKYLDNCFSNGENGQDEMIIFSLLNRNRSGLSSSKTFLLNLVKGIWTWKNTYSGHNKKIYDYYESMNHDNVYIFHPIK